MLIAPCINGPDVNDPVALHRFRAVRRHTRALYPVIMGSVLLLAQPASPKTAGGNVLTAVRTASSPTIDGKLTPGEWDNAAITMKGAPGWSSGDFRNVILRNNLLTGGHPDWDVVHNLQGVKLDWDHDGVMRMNSRLLDVRTRTHTALLGRINYDSFEQFFEETGLEEHGVEIRWADFAGLEAIPDGDKVVQPDAWDGTLATKGRAVDSGARLPNINDGFTGRAPDLGAYELGRAAPRYGPDPDVFSIRYEDFLRD